MYVDQHLLLCTLCCLPLASRAQAAHALTPQLALFRTLDPAHSDSLDMSTTSQELILAVATFRFDLDAGQSLEHAYPDTALTRDEITDIAYVALPVRISRML